MCDLRHRSCGCDYLEFLQKQPQGATKIPGTSAFAGTKTPTALKFPSKGATTACVETPVNCPHCGQKWRLRRRLRRQPFILLSFSSSEKPQKRRKRSHTNDSNASVIWASRVSQTPLQAPFPTSINGYHAAKKFLSQWPAKRSTFAFAGESGYTLGSRRKIAHSGSHAETRAFRMGVVSLPSERSARSQTSPGRVSERQVLPLLGLGRGCSQRTQKAFGTAMRLCASLFRGVAAPLGCVIQ